MSPSKPSTPSEGKPEDVAKVARDAADTKTAPVEDDAATAAAEDAPKPKARARRKKGKQSDRYIVRGRRRGKKGGR